MASTGIVVELPCEGNPYDDMCEDLVLLAQGMMLVRLLCSHKALHSRLLRYSTMRDVLIRHSILAGTHGLNRY